MVNRVVFNRKRREENDSESDQPVYDDWDDSLLLKAFSKSIGMLDNEERLKNAARENQSDEMPMENEAADVKFKYEKGDTVYALYFENGLLYKATILDISRAYSKIQFNLFNVQEILKISDVYDVGAIEGGEKSEELIYERKKFELSDVCKYDTGAGIVQGTIESISFDTPDTLHRSSVGTYHPKYELLLEDGQIIEELSEMDLMPYDWEGTREEYLEHSVKLAVKEGVKSESETCQINMPSDFHFPSCQSELESFRNDVKSKLVYLSNVLNENNCNETDKAMTTSWFLAGYFSALHQMKGNLTKRD